MIQVISVLAYLLLAPVLGILLEGVDRILSARMQGRKGPPLLQPLYDLVKLFSKQMVAVNSVQMLLNLSYLVFLAVCGAMFFSGQDLLMCFFLLATSDIFLVMSACSNSSPYADIGANREMLQMMAYEPIVLLTAVGFYLSAGSFNVSEIIKSDTSAVLLAPGMLLGLVLVFAVKLRKSPFDLSTSHHAHQEVIKGITTEMAGPTLAVMYIAEFYETVFLLGVIGLFFINSNPWSWAVAVLVCAMSYFMEVLMDNATARVKWKKLLSFCWIASILTGGLNLLVLMWK